MVGRRNSTNVIKFILLGFSEPPQLQGLLFGVFLLIYLMTLSWNLGLITLIRTNFHLHTPMYFFLSHLSFVDVCYSSSVVPKMLADFFKERKTISLMGCTIQCFVFVGMGGTECCLLAAMAYDRYVAICDPLRYQAAMTQTLCVRMVVAAHLGGFLTSLAETSSIFQLRFCGPNVIHHFFCDLPLLLDLSCSNSFISKVVNWLMVFITGVTSGLIVLISYLYIITTVVKIRPVKGRSKAFSTCASHLTVVTLFYGSGLFAYLHPGASHSANQGEAASLFYGAVIPMLNPIAYSLRNKEIKDALTKLKEAIDQWKIPWLEAEVCMKYWPEQNLP
ncbi:olfactory receptor 5A1-like [Ornithorhynchus anatinus]|uniref:olfactory receptor 5A1-like n=1 Tax=Ornithorhynchus anatinus TaxID=9258 RepID=UPI000454A424|nr:olfactory receptor 5A1-like [Ornithorhynchus anatinus]